MSHDILLQMGGQTKKNIHDTVRQTIIFQIESALITITNHHLLSYYINFHSM